MKAGTKVGFLGAGQMATALAKGLVSRGGFELEQVAAADVYPAARERFRELTGCHVTDSNPEICQFADCLVLAVKPQHVDAVLEPLHEFVAGKLLVSIAAGVTIERLESLCRGGARIVRVMPNTPSLVGAGASGYALGPGCGPADAECAKRILNAVGIAVEVSERLLDAVTGLSGSGPAYVYLIIESLADAGVAEGLPRDIALRLAAQTVLGAAQMVQQTGQHPAVLKDSVTSPAGTTAEGLGTLERAGVRGALLDAVRAATRRSRELGSNG